MSELHELEYAATDIQRRLESIKQLDRFIKSVEYDPNSSYQTFISRLSKEVGSGQMAEINIPASLSLDTGLLVGMLMKAAQEKLKEQENELLTKYGKVMCK